MLADPRARDTVLALHAPWLDLEGDPVICKAILQEQRPWQDLLRTGIRKDRVESVVASPDLSASVSEQMFRFATGSATLVDADRRFIADLATQSTTADFKLTDMLVNLVASDAFRSRPPVE